MCSYVILNRFFRCFKVVLLLSSPGHLATAFGVLNASNLLCGGIGISLAKGGRKHLGWPGIMNRLVWIWLAGALTIAGRAMSAPEAAPDTNAPPAG